MNRPFDEIWLFVESGLNVINMQARHVLFLDFDIVIDQLKHIAKFREY
jgi:hypothetical protein